MSAAMDLDLDPEPVASTSKSHDMDIDSPNGSPAPPVPPKTRPAHVPPALGKSQTMPAVLPSGNNHKGNTRPKLHSFFGNLKPRNLNRGEQSSSLVELPSKTSSPSKGKSKLKRNESAILEVPSPSSTSASNYNQHNYFPTTSPGHQAESLSAYVTAAFRWALSFLLLWTVLAVLRALVNDISERIHATSLQSRSALHECSRHFEQNCIPPRVSEWALREGLCDDWRICMEKDPRMVSRARIAAEILAEMIDAFVGGMGWKTLGFILCVSAILVSFTSSKPSSASPPPYSSPSPVPPDYGMMMVPGQPPFTPHRTNSAPPPRSPNARPNYYDSGSTTSDRRKKGWFG